MTNWGWIGASRTGISHIRAGIRLQDAYSVRIADGKRHAIAMAVSDGAGSAEFGGEGASLICRTLGTRFSESVAANGTLPSMQQLTDWVMVCRERIATAAERRGVESKAFAATLVFVVSDGEKSLFVHIGDGGVAAQLLQDGRWFCPTWPNQGEYASTTYFVTDEQGPRIRACEIDWPLRSLVVFSDGLERLALDFSNHEPHEPFFETMVRPLHARKVVGKDRELSGLLKEFLGSDRVNERTDDDKTLIVATVR